jgi:hypothetical protein
MLRGGRTRYSLRSSSVQSEMGGEMVCCVLGDGKSICISRPGRRKEIIVGRGQGIEKSRNAETRYSLAIHVRCIFARFLGVLVAVSSYR